MKRSQLLAAAFLALLLIAAMPSQMAQAQGTYSERLNVFVAGSDALWYFTFGGLNSSSKFSSFESSAGLSSYNITAIKGTQWSSDFQIFGSKGYDLLPVPFVPSEELFLTVGSDSFTDAQASASALGSYLLTSFVSLSNRTGTYSFFSPLSFADLVPTTLLKLVPTTEHGFASAIGSPWSTTSSPFISLNGQKGTSGFSRNLVVGSISASALDTLGKPSVLSYFGTNLAQLQASSHSSSSVIMLNFLDGIVNSKDAGALVTSDNSHFTGSYKLTLAPGKHISKVNATVVQQPADLLATRSISSGVLRSGSDFAVTLTMKNLSPTETITRIRFSDTWWNKTGSFNFLSGNNTVPGSSLAPGTSVTPVYRLKYTGTASGSLTIPASIVRYTYNRGGVTFNATAILNPIRLSLGVDEAVVVATLVPSGGFGKPLGAHQNFNVTVTNVGTEPASSVVVAGKSISGLAAESGSTPGGTASVAVSQSSSGLLGINITKSYSATYQDPAGSSLNATTNVVSNVFSHSTMNLGYPSLTVGVQISVLNQRTNLTLSLTTSNSLGHANFTSFSATATLPSGLGCGAVKGKSAATKGVTCVGGNLSILYPTVNATGAFTAYLEYNITAPQNFLISPIAFSAVSAGISLTGLSNPSAIATGIAISKQFSPSQLFPGMSSQVTVSANNAGPLPYYNVSLGTTVDSFDSLTGASNLTKSAKIWSSGVTKSFSYSVSLSQVSGAQKGTAPTADFYFEGTFFSVSGIDPAVSVYAPLAITISTSPAVPEEGKNFTMNFQISNPSGVTVSNVLFTLPLPAGLGLSSLTGATVTSRILDISVPTLASGVKANASARAVASSGITVPFNGAKLTFTYSGITINGVVPKNGIAISEDVTTRYIIPTGFVLLVVLAAAFYVRWKASPTALSSRK